MKKTLLLLAALVAAAFTTAQAEDILWQEDFSSYEAEAVPAGGTYKYVCVDGAGATKIYAEALAGGTTPELLINKYDTKKHPEPGSFSVTVPMNGKSGEMTLSFKRNNKALDVTATGAELGKMVRTGNTDEYPVTVAAGTTEVTFTFTAGSANVRFDDAKLYQGTAKKPAGLSWGTATREVTIGSSENKFPTLSNANELPVTYASSETSVATIAQDGTITLVAEGKTTVSAAFAGNDTYEAQTVTYELTVKPAADPSEDISNTPETAYTVAKARELIDAGKGLSSKVYVKGIVKKVQEIDTTGTFGNATYFIWDAEGEDDMEIYRGYGLNGQKFNEAGATLVEVGDVVIVYGQMTKYKETYEFSANSQIYSIVKGGPTGIQTLGRQKAASRSYDLQGRVAPASQRGVVLTNGQKVLVK